MKNKTRKCLFLSIAMLNFWSVGLQAQEKKELFTKENLSSLSHHLDDTQGKAFTLFLKNPEKVNSVLGKDQAQYALRKAISKTYFQDIDPVKKPNFDWTALQKIMKSKYGEIGLEALHGKQMMYYLEAKDWKNYGKYYVLYFKKALKRPEYVVNNITWPLFENVNDPKILKFACDVVMKYAMEEWYQTDFNAYDTYANLLYKTGKKDEAIEWEEKAAKLSNNDKVIVENLEKMKNNQATWITPASANN
jgi:tetratricopeptide (TPR) repeat protein